MCVLFVWVLQWLLQTWWTKELQCGTPLSGSPRVPLVLRGASPMGRHPRGATMKGKRWIHWWVETTVLRLWRGNCRRLQTHTHTLNIPEQKQEVFNNAGETKEGAKMQGPNNYPDYSCVTFAAQKGECIRKNQVISKARPVHKQLEKGLHIQ